MADALAQTAHDRLFAEILVVVEIEGAILRLLHRDDPWHIEVRAGDDPMTTVRQAVADVFGSPVLVHSTSWRTEDARVLLTFIAVVEPDGRGQHPSREVSRADLARGDATHAPASVSVDAVLEHALRHLAWLVDADPVVAGALGDGWHQALAAYTPEPFAALDRVDNPLVGIDGDVRLSCHCGFRAEGKPADIVAAIAAHALETHQNDGA